MLTVPISLYFLKARETAQFENNILPVLGLVALPIYCTGVAVRIWQRARSTGRPAQLGLSGLGYCGLFVLILLFSFRAFMWFGQEGFP